jgi:RNA polymerase sigma-70 factor (ECF subfamily)
VSAGHALGLSDGAVRTALHRLRHRFGTALREQVAETVASTDEVDEELRFLFAALDV